MKKIKVSIFVVLLSSMSIMQSISNVCKDALIWQCTGVSISGILLYLAQAGVKKERAEPVQQKNIITSWNIARCFVLPFGGLAAYHWCATKNRWIAGVLCVLASGYVVPLLECCMENKSAADLNYVNLAVSGLAISGLSLGAVKAAHYFYPHFFKT